MDKMTKEKFLRHYNHFRSDSFDIDLDTLLSQHWQEGFDAALKKSTAAAAFGRKMSNVRKSKP